MGVTLRKGIKQAIRHGDPNVQMREEENRLKRELEQQRKAFEGQQKQWEAEQKRREQESQNQARLSAQLAADSGYSDDTTIQTGGDILGGETAEGKRRRRRGASGASAVGL